MSDSVHFHLEQMLPELRDLEERGIFNRVKMMRKGGAVRPSFTSSSLTLNPIHAQTEIKAIVKKRTALEYAIHRRISLKADYLKYIEYELNLEQLRRKRKERLGIDKDNNTPTNTPAATPAPSSKGSVSDYSILKRIHALYSKALKKFGGKDVDLWVQYFEWCKELGSSKALNSMLAR